MGLGHRKLLTWTLHRRSLLLSLCLHASLMGLLYYVGYGALNPSRDRALTLSFERPPPAPDIEASPEPEREEVEKPETEEPVEVELYQPPIPVPSPEKPPKPRWELDDRPFEPEPQAWLRPLSSPEKTKVVEEKPPSRKDSTQARKKASLPAAEPQPLAGKNPPPRYPRYAVQHGITGTVLLEVQVDDEGIPSKVRILRSSGSRILDEAAQRAMWTWRFDRGPGKTRIPIVFTLESRH